MNEIIRIPGISSEARKTLWTSSPLSSIDTLETKNERTQEDMTDKMRAGFLGRTVSEGELAEIKEILDSCQSLSRTEIACTICELFSWKRPSGKLKAIECRQFLERLESEGLVELPVKGRKNSNTLLIPQSNRSEAAPSVRGGLSGLSALSLKKVTTREERNLWYEYVERYHYLGYRRPFGAQLRYFIQSSQHGCLGCLQFSSAAWKMAPRDQWIGWNDEQRRRNLQRIISNSRFLLLPWVQVKNLASFVLALSLRQVVDDWESMYGIRPVMVETLVDRQRFRGTCYKAANWVYLGVTTGRGRMDQANRRQGLFPKDIYVYPFRAGFRRYLLT